MNYSYEPTDELNLSVNPADAHRTFMGYERPNGEVGIRNEIWIINTVGCINKKCELLAQKGTVLFGGQVDGIHHFAHPFGCSQLGDDLKFRL